MYRTVFLLVCSFLYPGCAPKEPVADPLPYYNEASFTPLFLSDKQEINEKITHHIADFSFLNQDSQYVNQDFIANKIHVANFMFTSCGSICPVMTQNLKTVYDAFEKEHEITFLSFTVTPWIDNPTVLKKYRKQQGISGGKWQFLTGSGADIYRLARQSYFAEEEIGYSKDSTEFLHTEHFILADKAGRIRGIYNGTLGFEMQQLIADIHTLRQEYK